MTDPIDPGGFWEGFSKELQKEAFKKIARIACLVLLVVCAIGAIYYWM